MIEIQKEVRQLEELTQNQLKKMQEYPDSVAKKALLAAQEKIADTYISCSDQASAQNIPDAIKYASYTDNHNDMKVVYNNWRMHRTIEDSKPLRKAMGYDKQACNIL